MPKPLIFLAFANDRDDREQYLRNLPEEARHLEAALKEAEDKNLCEIVSKSNVTLDQVLDVLQQHRDRLAIFHFGGHANSLQLVLETPEGRPGPAHAGGLAAFLHRQTALQLVFLNGCSTEPQVQGLLDAGVPAVIATSCRIDDEVAMQFSERFYRGLGSGADVATAYHEAEAAVQARKGDTVRGVYRGVLTYDGSGEAVAEDRWPWEMYIRPGADAAGHWNLPDAAGDPLFGLPALPDMDLPESPFRYLDWFRREDAPVFFGRGFQIRDLYERVTAPGGEPVILFYGQAGVGKSSLLAAGLLPRLEGDHDVRYLRRDQAHGLAGDLWQALDAVDGTSLREAWLDLEAQTDKPVVVILDQAEEVFTRPQPGQADELAAFLDAVQPTLVDREQRPRGRLILGFRKEWLAEIKNRFVERHLPHSEVFLQRLDRRGIGEAVEGVASSEPLQRKYGLMVEDGLADLIAGDLLSDAESPIAPTLQVLLSKMWDRARDQAYTSPVFTEKLYQDLSREGILLEDFLDQQLGALTEWSAPVVDSGLALDVLAHHTTRLGTAEERAVEELNEEYAHRQDVLPGLVQECRDRYLLVDPAEHQPGKPLSSRLSHDTLAPLVRARFDESDLPGQRARRILENRAVDWRDAAQGEPLDGPDLQVVEGGAGGMRAWTQAEERLVAMSRQQREKRRRERRIVRMAGISAVVLIVLVAAVAGWQWQRAETERQEAAHRLYIAAAQKLLLEATNQGALDRAALLACQAYRFNWHWAAGLLDPIDELLRSIHRGLYFSRAFYGHEDQVMALTFHPDGWTLASGSDDGTVRLWDLTDPGAEPAVLTGHEGNVSSVAFHPDGRTVASGSDDGTVRLWDLTDPGAESAVLTGHEGNVSSVAFHPDGHTLASGGADGTVRLWDLTGLGVEPMVLRGHKDRVRSLAFHPEGRSLASGSYDETIRLWDLTDPGAEPAVLVGHEDGVSSVAFHPDGRTLASGSHDDTIRLWDLTALWAEPIALTWHWGWVTSVAFHADGRTLVSGSHDGTVRLWDLTDPGAEPTVLSWHEGNVWSVAFHPDGRTLASGNWEGTVRLWDLTGPAAEPIVLTGHEDWVSFLAFHPDGRTLASGSWDDTVRLWDLTDPTAEPAVLVGHEDGVTSVAFHPDGRTLASGSYYALRLWDLTDLAPEPAVLVEHEDLSNPVAFHPGWRTLACYSYDAVHLWDLTDPTAEPAELYDREYGFESVALHPDGLTMACGGGDGTVRLWLTPDGLVNEACKKVWRNLTWEEWQEFVGEGIPYECTCPEWPAGFGVPGDAIKDGSCLVRRDA